MVPYSCCNQRNDPRLRKNSADTPAAPAAAASTIARMVRLILAPISFSGLNTTPSSPSLHRHRRYPAQQRIRSAPPGCAEDKSNACDQRENGERVIAQRRLHGVVEIRAHVAQGVAPARACVRHEL